jgi:glycosyltransferase involved in cell wall biosynthesis
MSRPLRSAHVGNIANNAYLLAKGLRALGHAADSFDLGGGFPVALPYWQEAEFDPRQTADAFWDWAHLPLRAPWRRPPWAKILGADGAAPCYDTQEAFQADLARIFRGSAVTPPRAERERRLAALLAQGRVSVAEQPALLDAALAVPLPAVQSIATLARGYDLLVLYGQYAAYAPFVPRGTPLVTFEHGTMRYIHQLATPEDRLLAAAYQMADWNVITNADCWEAAGALGVRGHSSFIPHPVDTQTCAPVSAAPGGTQVDDARQVREALGCELLFFAPCRHSSVERIGSKRTDRTLYAYHRYVHDAEARGHPRAGLVLVSWGERKDVEAMDGLGRELGLSGRVAWLPLLPKVRLVRWYQMADIVLDQFSETVGSFGTTTMEAMACAKPVLTYYRDAAHTWCRDVLPEPPPVKSARTVDEIYEALCYWAKHPEARQAMGAHGRAWVERYHTLERTAKLHAAIYRRVVDAYARRTGVATAAATAMDTAVPERLQPQAVAVATA